MKELLVLLQQIPTITSILAFRSLFSWEGLYCYATDNPFAVSGDDNVRYLYAKGVEEPILIAQTEGEFITLQADQRIGSYPEILLLMSAAGLSAFPSREGFKFTSAGLLDEQDRMDAEKLWDRILTLDSAWCNLHNPGFQVPEGNDLVNVLIDIYARAKEWIRLRAQDFEEYSDITTFNVGLCSAKLRDLDSWNLPGLKAVNVHSDIRGSGFILDFGDGRERTFCDMPLNWPAGRYFRPELYAAASKVTFGKFDVRPTVIAQSVHSVLAECTVEGQEVFIRQRLTPALYKKVNEALIALGGKWHSGKQSHVFDEDPAVLIESVVVSGAVYTRRDYEFFWTPEELGYQALQLAELKPGMVVMEPSAGDGALAKLAAVVVGIKNVRCFELMPKNVQALRLAGFNVEEPIDFLATTPVECIDVALMNPPFSGFKDMAHIQHAYKWLRPGGRLVAIASTQWQSHETKPAEAARKFLKDLNARVQNIPRGTFKDAGTDVETTLIVLDKPKPVVKPVEPAAVIPLVGKSTQVDLFELFA